MGLDEIVFATVDAKMDLHSAFESDIHSFLFEVVQNGDSFAMKSQDKSLILKKKLTLINKQLTNSETGIYCILFTGEYEIKDIKTYINIIGHYITQ